MTHTEFYLQYTELSQDEINMAFISACAFSNLKAAKYLLFSEEPPFNAQWDKNKFSAFKVACLNQNDEIIAFLVNEMKIESNYEIKEFLENKKNPYASSLFLNRDIPKSNIKHKLLKI